MSQEVPRNLNSTRHRSNLETDTTSSGTDVGDAVLEITDLKKTFQNGSVLAVDNVSLTIESEEFVVLLGPSGCGKTTTLRCIAGLELPDEGTIRLHGRDITDLKPHRRNLAFVFQDTTLFPHMSVKKNIQYGLDMMTALSEEEKTEMVRDVARLLDIEDKLEEDPGNLSGGQQQRVSLGRAMVMDPDLFLLDEPFTALDANLRDHMRTKIKELQRTVERTMIFVTHNQEEALTVGDKVVVMNEGQVYQAGSPYEVYYDPQNLFVASFIGSPTTNMFECTVSADDDAVVLSHDVLEYSFVDERAERLRPFVGETVTLAVRPEFIELDDSEGLFSADVRLRESHGTHDVIYLERGDTEISVIVPPAQIEHEDETKYVSFSEDVWVFGQTGQRLV
jgi:multiple sugar transport system ATP-binding protein